MRVQLALNVTNLDESIDFYQKMFGVDAAKVKPGYANFAIENPPLKLILFETDQEDVGGTLNHLGVEVETANEVEVVEKRLTGAGIDTTGVDEIECCYASKTETWVNAPDNSWEWYVKNGDLATESGDTRPTEPTETTCCPV